MTLRVVSYSINGRGMGHLVRQLAILRWVRRIGSVLDLKIEPWVLTSSEADTLARREGFAAFKLPSKAMMRDAGIEPARVLATARTWVMNAIAGLRPDLLIVDTFPGGSFGELIGCLELAPHRVLVARRVRDRFAEEDGYEGLLPLYDRLIVPDERGAGPILLRERPELLSRADARAALGVPGDQRAVYVTLGGGGDPVVPTLLPKLVPALTDRGWHVVVGAGPLYAGPELRGPSVTWMSRYAPLELLAGVDAAVSACGYNSFHELMFAGVPTVFLPQPRIADDQLARAERAVEAGAGRLAQRWDEVADLLEDPGDGEAARALVPRNGAREAARQVLATVVPEAELALALELLSDPMLEALRGTSREHTKGALELLRLLGPGTPRDHARRASALADLRRRGHEAPDEEPPGAAVPRVARFLELSRACGAPFETALSLLTSLARKFPAASGQELLEAAEVLFPCWARFDDWMGAVSILRALPTQRTFRLEGFSAELAAWLETEDDLFDALRSFTRLEAGGERTAHEALRLLRSAEAAQ